LRTDFESQKPIIKDFVLTKVTKPVWQWVFKHIIEILENVQYCEELHKIFPYRYGTDSIDRSYAYKGGTHGKPDSLLYVVYEIVDVVEDLEFIEWLMDNFSYADHVVLDVAPDKIRLPYLKKMLKNKDLRKPVYVDFIKNENYWLDLVYRSIFLHYPHLDTESIDLILAHEQLHRQRKSWQAERVLLASVLHPSFDFSNMTLEILPKPFRSYGGLTYSSDNVKKEINLLVYDLRETGNNWNSLESRIPSIMQMIDDYFNHLKH